VDHRRNPPIHRNAWLCASHSPPLSFSDLLFNFFVVQGLFEPLNVRADGTVVFALPTGRAKIPLVTLKDIGWWARYAFDHRTETSGQDLRIASHIVSADEIVKVRPLQVHYSTPFTEGIPRHSPKSPGNPPSTSHKASRSGGTISAAG
jgi:hypothetical protein